MSTLLPSALDDEAIITLVQRERRECLYLCWVRVRWRGVTKHYTSSSVLCVHVISKDVVQNKKKHAHVVYQRF